ncbi:hypothetical protein KCU92_g206, partial [Aureobasidium melanogenum]
MLPLLLLLLLLSLRLLQPLPLVSMLRRPHSLPSRSLLLPVPLLLHKQLRGPHRNLKTMTLIASMASSCFDKVRWSGLIVKAHGPLSFPDHPTQSVTITRDRDLRPWLAWSVPPYTHQALNQVSHPLHYSSFDFNALAQGKYGPGTTEIDASIMAAKAIDATYTPFCPSSRSETQSYTEIRWDAIYLGAEKIWVNEPVRLAAPAGQEAPRVLVVRAIVERSQKSSQQAYSSVSFIGDVYVMLPAPMEPITMSRAPNGIVSGSDTTNVPLRLIEDIRRRNIATIQAKGKAYQWKLLERNKVVDLKEVKGRWYESTLFLPILLPRQADEYEERVREGVIPEVLVLMNGHGDCNKDPNDHRRLLPDVRAATREQAWGKAVPARTIIQDNSNRPVATQPPAPAQQQQQSRVTSGGGVAPGYQIPNGHQNHASVAPASNNASISASATSSAQQIPDNPATGFEEFMDLEGLGGADMMALTCINHSGKRACLFVLSRLEANTACYTVHGHGCLQSRVKDHSRKRTASEHMFLYCHHPF